MLALNQIFSLAPSLTPYLFGSSFSHIQNENIYQKSQ